MIKLTNISFRSKLLLIVIPLLAMALILLFLTSSFINGFAEQVTKLSNEELVNQKYQTLISESKDVYTESNALLYHAKDTLLRISNKEERPSENFLVQLEIMSGKISTITGQLISLNREEKSNKIKESYHKLELVLKQWGDDCNQNKLKLPEATEDFSKNRKMLKNFIKEEITFEDGPASVTPEILSSVNKAQERFKVMGVFFIGIILVISLFAFYLVRNLVQFEIEGKKSMFEAVRSFNIVEKSPINIMMSSPEGTIALLNESARNNLSTLQSLIPEKIENLIGKNIDLLHKNPEMVKRIIADPKNLPHKSIIALGPEAISLVVAAIYDANGKYIGPMVTWEFVTEKVALVKDLTKSSEDLALSAANVLSISSNLSAAAEETSAQANTASVAAEEVNAGVQTVASNMGEMVVAIRNITKTTQEASALTNEAMRITSNTNTLINQLGVSSMDIGNVIKVISSIAQQTNLLALNATIEAARAGDAGKGFAVVANEVKELANQTAIATNEITQKIEAIQTDSKNAVSAIAEISKAIEKVNGYNGSIALAVETQATTTNEVTRVVSEAAEGVKQINENISQVSSAAASTGKDAGKSQEAAEAVGRIATQLNKYVASLKV